MARHRRGGKTIDSVHWTYGTGGAFALADTASAAVSMIPAQHLPETLLRIRGEWAATLDGFLAPAASARVTIGVIQVPEGTGTTVLWDPENDGDAPWIFWDVMQLSHEESVIDVMEYGLGSARRVVDSKAMRKLCNTELQLVIHNASLSNSPPINAFFAARFLSGS